MNRGKRPTAVRVAAGAMGAVGLACVVIGGVTAAQAASSAGVTLMEWIVPTLMFGNAVVLFVLGAALYAQKRWGLVLTLLFFAATVALTIMDEVGIYDLLYLALVAALGVYLWVTRQHYSR